MQLFEKQISREVIFKGKIFTVARDINELSDGKQAPRELVLHSGGAGILPVDSNGNVTLVKQYRCGVSGVMTEICAGKLEKGEDPKECAIREMVEELGFTARNVVSLGSFAPTPAYDSEITYIYLATDLEYVGQKLDDGEFLEIVKMPLCDAVEAVMNGTVSDGKTQIAILKAERLLNGKT